MRRAGMMAAIALVLIVAAFVAAILLESRGREVPDGASGDGGFDV